jgi:hypothetical protein
MNLFDADKAGDNLLFPVLKGIIILEVRQRRVDAISIRLESGEFGMELIVCILCEWLHFIFTKKNEV